MENKDKPEYILLLKKIIKYYNCQRKKIVKAHEGQTWLIFKLLIFTKNILRQI